MMNYTFMILDSLQKVLPWRRPDRLTEEQKHFYALTGERVSFQLAYSVECDAFDSGLQVRLSLDSGLSEHIRVRNVELVPSGLSAYHGQTDDNYLFTGPCLCPDLLVPVKNEFIRPIPNQWRALWFTLETDHHLGEGVYAVTLTASRDEELLWEDSVHIHVLDEELPEQRLIHTEWFHADCLADYYRVPVFSGQHWRIIENFVECAVRHGINMLLTPIFTPPLDTEEGGERTTVQLVKVMKQGSLYQFDFSLLSKWIRMCLQKGIKYIEISHLFTQWGAKHAPKIMAWENGEEKQIFGWDTRAEGAEYLNFLRQLLPRLKTLLKKEGVLERTFFHISDEPAETQLESYRAAQNCVRDLLGDCRIIDALSSFELYREGVVDHPIPCSDHIRPFLDAGVKDLWTYYCCAQSRGVSNRFMAMPPARIRILGVQLYLYDIRGFLHWGFNFYNAQYSLYPVNPYLITDAGGAFPSGDPFVVYPAEDGTAYDSLRLEVFTEALYDLRALQKLEDLTDRSHVASLIQEGLEYRITFDQYPRDASYIRQLRRKVCREIKNNRLHNVSGQSLLKV